MSNFLKKNALISVGTATLLLLGAFILINQLMTKKAPTQIVSKTIETEKEVIGTSGEGRAIEAHTFGTGNTRLLFVGGIHGGYEWNSVLVAYQFIDYIKENPTSIPKNLTVSIIPSANPDGLYRVIQKEGRFMPQDVPSDTKLLESGRFNANNVDLNRNFACNWQPTSMWKSKTVSAGAKVFSEPEALAIRDFVTAHTPDSVIFWHSKANAVYASECNSGILPKTLELMNVYAKASKYTAIKSFTAYKTSGDAEGWLASINIPAITVELSTHEDIEWDRNLAGIKALFSYYSTSDVQGKDSELDN